jgi:hypothetical protein
MIAKYIKEELSMFKSKDNFQIIEEYVNQYVWNNAGDWLHIFFQTLEDKGISREFINENEEKIIDIFTEVFTGVLSYMIEVEMEPMSPEEFMKKRMSESLEDTFQPKSREEIVDFLREEEWDEFELEDGRQAWLIEDSFPGMAGETVTVYKIFVDDGSEYTLNNDTLDELPFTMDDRMGLIELIDDTNEENYNNAIAFVK